MELVVDGNSEYVAHAWTKRIGIFIVKDPICDFSRYNQKPCTDQLTEIPYKYYILFVSPYSTKFGRSKNFGINMVIILDGK